MPVFLAGLAAVLGVWLGRPLWRGTELQRFERDLAAVRRALGESPKDLNGVVGFAEELSGRIPQFPQRAGELQLLLGSVYLRLSQDVREALAREYRRQAREHLEQAAASGVPDTDRAKLGYRLAKAWFLTGGDWQQIVRNLEASVESAADDAFEGYGMLAQAYLRMPTPNPTAALEASKKQLASPCSNEALLAPARLFHGELLLQLHMPEQAQQILARVGTDAAPEIAERARMLRAQSCFDLGRWQDAAHLWEEALQDSRRDPQDVVRIRFQLGRCYAKLGKSAQACEAWRQVLSGGAEEAQAAALALAELYVKDAKPEESLRYLEQAARHVEGSAGYRNHLISREDARAVFERACRLAREQNKFDVARQIALKYEPIAAPGVAAELRGLAEEAWATSCREAQHEDEARPHAQEAAAAFAAVAEAAPDRAARARWLRRSADRYLDARDRAQALMQLQKYVRAEPDAERVAEGWFALAKVYEELPNEALAADAYRKCIEFPGPFAFRARFRLAELDIARGKLDDAEKTLLQNLELARLAGDDAEYQRTALALADLFYQRGNYRMAQVYYQDVLERLPSDERHTKPRFRLADCYHRLAIQLEQELRGLLPPKVRLYYQEQYPRWLRLAADHYQKLSLDLASRRWGTALSREDESILRQSDFALVECLIMLGQYDEALRVCEVLAGRYDHEAEHLRALREMWRCHWIRKEPQKAAATLQRVRTLLRELDERHFTDYPPTETREDWYRWVESNSAPQPSPAGRRGPTAGQAPAGTSR